MIKFRKKKADKDIDKGLAGVFFHAGREVVGADGQHPAEGYQGQIRVHIVLIQFLQRPHAQ